MTVMMTARKPGEMEGDKGTGEEGWGGRVGGRGGVGYAGDSRD